MGTPRFPGLCVDRERPPPPGHIAERGRLQTKCVGRRGMAADVDLLTAWGRTHSSFMKRVAILGAGGMGTALAVLFAKSARSVQLWARDPSRAAALSQTRENSRHLPGVRLPDHVEVTPNACDATGGADLVVVAIPSA